MKYLIPVLFFLLLIITSCNQLYRSIPKAPRHKVVLVNKESEYNQSDVDFSQVKSVQQEIELSSEEKIGSGIEVDEEIIATEIQTHDKQKDEVSNLQLNTVKDTLIVDADVLEEGENCVRLQTVVNVGTSLMIFIFLFSLIFIGIGIYNINKYNNLPYVTQETDEKMKRKIRNFYIALGLYLFLFLLIIAFIILI